MGNDTYTFYNLNPYKNDIYKKFYDKLFNDLDRYYVALGFPENCNSLFGKAIYMPWNFIDLLSTRSMVAANGKYQCAHSYKLNYRMECTRYEHMCFAYMLGIDLLLILEKNGYEIDAITKTAFLLKLLLHDNGHGPFSHPFEMMVDGYKGMHEDIGDRNILEDKQLYDCLEKLHPGLANYIVNFKEMEPYGLNEVVEGIFDLDRAAFLIIDTWLSNSKIWDENNNKELSSLIEAIYNIFENIILKDGHIYYNPSCFNDMQFFLKKRTYNYCNLYQEEGRVLDDLLLHEAGVSLGEQSGSNEHLKDIMQHVERFNEFIKTIKAEQSKIDLDLYYSYQDANLERMMRAAQLYDDEILDYYSRLFLSPYYRMMFPFIVKKYDKQEDYDKDYIDNPDSLRTINKITVYKSTPEEHIVFYDSISDTYTDFKDMPERTLDINPILEYIVYKKKEGKKLDNEDVLRNYFVSYFYQNAGDAYFNCSRCICNIDDVLDGHIIKELSNLLKYILEGNSLEEYAKNSGISMNQLYTLLSFYAMDGFWQNAAIFMKMSSEELGMHFEEIYADNEKDKDEYIEFIKGVLRENKPLADAPNYYPDLLFKELCITVGNIVFIDLATLNSFKLDSESRDKINNYKIDCIKLKKEYPNS